jgi:hypothetical protein
MTPDDRDPVVDTLFDGLEPPPPPPHLRARVLAAAKAETSGASDVWTRIWQHRGMRLAWAAAVMVLLAGHLFVVPGNPAGIEIVDQNLIAENRVDEHLVEFLRPMRISDNIQPIVGLLAFAGDPFEGEMKGNPS